MEIFISWSGKRSKFVAIQLSDLIERLLPSIRPWMSSMIDPGERWFEEIGNKLSTNTIGIICVTPENQSRPWLLFEAGAISKIVDKSNVCPILIGMDPDDIMGPLINFQSIRIKKNEIFKLLILLNNRLGEHKCRDKILEEEFEIKWPSFIKSVKEGLESVEMKSAQALPGILNAIRKSEIGEPEIGKTVYFKKGFESYNLYEIAVQNAKNRLLILGRKNRKLFDKNFEEFFEKLPQQINNGFEFKCLFLDPDSPDHIVRAAHQNDDFHDELNTCVKSAQVIMKKYNIDVKEHFRFYKIQRTTEIIIIDDAVLYSQIRIDSDGRALKLTKSHFRLTSIFTDDGIFNLKQFENFWNSSQIK